MVPKDFSRRSTGFCAREIGHSLYKYLIIMCTREVFVSYIHSFSLNVAYNFLFEHIFISQSENSLTAISTPFAIILNRPRGMWVVSLGIFSKALERKYRLVSDCLFNVSSNIEKRIKYLLWKCFPCSICGKRRLAITHNRIYVNTTNPKLQLCHSDAPIKMSRGKVDWHKTMDLVLAPNYIVQHNTY